MVDMKIEEIEGIGETFGAKLREIEITSTDKLLDAGCTPKGRKDLAQKTGMNEKALLKWINMADLFRVKGVGSEYAELLKAAGVDTVKELRTRNAENLYLKLEEINKEGKHTRQLPSLNTVSKWVEEAKGLLPKLEY